MARLDIFILHFKFCKSSLPKIVPILQRIRLVAHAHAIQALAPGEIKGETQDSFHPFASVDIFLHSDLIRSAFLKDAAHADVNPLGVLPYYNETNVAFTPIL